MYAARNGQTRARKTCVLIACVAFTSLALCATAQSQFGPPAPQNASARPPSADGQIVADIQIEGNQSISAQEIRAELTTRPGQRLDSLQIQRDVRSLILTKKFFDVKVRTRPAAQAGTVVVIYQVFEFPKVRHVHLIGNTTVASRTLRKKFQLKVGDPLDPVMINEARKKLEKYYHENGFNKARVDVREGNSRQDPGAAFVIHEGPQQRVWSVEFVGNSFVSDGRLVQQIESRPSKLKYISSFDKSFVDRDKINEDVNRLTSYYRGFGYMLARVGREVDFDEKGRYAKVRFVVDEGPRFRIRSISFNGNQTFGNQQLRPLVAQKTGDHFDLAALKKDVQQLTDAYGSVGYILADINPSPRTLESTPEVDLVYEVNEGERYRVGQINVKIAGENPHTKRTVALNRLSFRPGDIVDIREIRDSERRLRASGLFLSDPLRGVRPRIVFREIDNKEFVAGRSNGSVTRGQSPESGVEVQIYRDRSSGHPTSYTAPSWRQR
jgi:outer membrane protein insertion porin family